MLSFIGGTGPEGLGLAFRFLLAGHDIVIGSRSAERASAAADKLTEMLAAVPAEKAGSNVGKASGMENEPAVAASNVVIITVPYSGTGRHPSCLAGCHRRQTGRGYSGARSVRQGKDYCHTRRRGLSRRTGQGRPSRRHRRLGLPEPERRDPHGPQ